MLVVNRSERGVEMGGEGTAGCSVDVAEDYFGAVSVEEGNGCSSDAGRAACEDDNFVVERGEKRVVDCEVSHMARCPSWISR